MCPYFIPMSFFKIPCVFEKSPYFIVYLQRSFVMAFTLNSYPVVYRAKYNKGSGWADEYIEKNHRTPAEEAALSPAERDALEVSRNYYDDMPLVNFTSQYGLGCFEGMKALPQKNGDLAIFRPEQNAKRFKNSMVGLKMPGFPEDSYLKACIEVVKRNAALGFRPYYNPEWEKDAFMTADSIYMRPFTLSESGIGVSLSKEPYVVIVTTPVSAYFSEGSTEAIITERIRATPKGTGWIKAASNYVISALAKAEAADAGFMECIFLDATHRKYIEEGSSCNIFFYLKSGELVTPELGDTILPGITRASVIELAKDQKVKISERKVSIDEVIADAAECFVTGTAAGVTPITGLAYNGKKVVFSKGETGQLTAVLRDTLKGIQYGTLEDTKGWMVKI